MVDLKKLRILGAAIILVGLIIGFVPRGSNPDLGKRERSDFGSGLLARDAWLGTQGVCGSAFVPDKDSANEDYCFGDKGTMQLAAYGGVIVGAGLITLLWLRKDEGSEASS
jgi:uncharacterized protein YjeT (DUF2065 family)